MRIFVGSSKQKLLMAKRIAKDLRDDGHEVLGWWQEAAFRSGDYTLESLIEISNDCDGAVFIFGKDDEIWFSEKQKKGKKKTKLQNKARDNVVLEYGLFVGKHGRKRVAIVTQRDVVLPTDLKGITYIGKDHFKKIRHTFNDPVTAKIWKYNRIFHVYPNKKLALNLMTNYPGNWSSRVLYLGEQGAENWKNVEEDPDYTRARGYAQVLDSIAKMTNGIDVRIDNIISFGPGIGLSDIKVINKLKIKSHKYYIPVDINYNLINYATQNVDMADAETTVPFAIHGDFEDGMSEIGDIIKKQVYGINFFLMLGGTFGNLEKGEIVFLKNLHNCMNLGDYFLLDTFVKSEVYSDQVDGFRILGKQAKTVQKFLAYGVSRKTGMKVDEIRDRLDKYLFHGDVGSDVDKTAGFCFMIKSLKAPLLQVRRYQAKALAKFLENIGFKVIEYDQLRTENKAADRGIYLLQKEKS